MLDHRAVVRPASSVATVALAIALMSGADVGAPVLSGTVPSSAAAEDTIGSPDTVELEARLDTHLLKSRPRSSFGSAHQLAALPQRAQALVSFRTPAPDQGQSIDSAELCVTPIRDAETRILVFPAPDEWGNATTWSNRPAPQSARLARSSFGLKAGRRTCMPVPAAAIEAGQTEFRLKSARSEVPVKLASLESSASQGPTLRLTAKRPKGSPSPSSSTPQPLGPSGTWNLLFQDEFAGTTVDWSKWSDSSSAEADAGHGNKGNQQLEWNQGANCGVTNGLLTITAKPDGVTSPSGIYYDWSSCLLSSAPSYAFQYGYMETRARFPAAPGFWPGFWTWQAPGVDRWIETDAFEYYSDNKSRLYLSQHSGAGGGCTLSNLGFDPTSDFHTYGVDIHSSGTDFFIDGRLVCSAPGTSDGRTNIILDMFVYALVPPAAGTVGRMQVDYVRAWQR